MPPPAQIGLFRGGPGGQGLGGRDVEGVLRLSCGGGAEAEQRAGGEGLDQYPVTVQIHFDFDNPNRRDPANYAPTAKAVIDGFGPPANYERQGKRVVAAGAAWWTDDGPAYVTEAPITCTYAGKVAGLYATVTITPATP